MTTTTLTQSQPLSPTAPRERIVLGIDPGYARCGVGVIVVDRHEPQSLYYGCLETESHLPTTKRLELIFEGIESLLTQYRPSIVAIERVFFHNNSKTAMGVAEVRGILLLAAARARVHTIELTPPEVKSTITGNGQADKLQVQRLVALLLHLHELPKPDDAADALAIAIAAQAKVQSVPYGHSL